MQLLANFTENRVRFASGATCRRVAKNGRLTPLRRLALAMRAKFKGLESSDG